MRVDFEENPRMKTLECSKKGQFDGDIAKKIVIMFVAFKCMPKLVWKHCLMLHIYRVIMQNVIKHFQLL